MKNFNIKIQKRFKQMCETQKLFRSELTGQQVWDLYLVSFDPKDNITFRDPESSEHNCNTCKNFIRRYGNILAVDENNKLMSIFDLYDELDSDSEYIDTAKAMSKALTESKISEVFFETYESLKNLPYEKCTKTNNVFRLGIPQNLKKYTREEVEKFGVVNTSDIYEFNHFHLDLPKLFVDLSGKSVEALMGEYRDNKNVFKRGLDTIGLDTLELVKDLILQGSLLNGDSHLYKIEEFITYKKVYDSLSSSDKDNWAWSKSYKLNIAKFRNELIGVLCTELAEGEELNKACLSWNKRVDPANYMKAVAPITKRQIEEAKKFVIENGYEESFKRRYATIDDIKASEIQHINIGDGSIKNVSIFDSVQPSTSNRHKRNEFDNVETVDIEHFISKILPSCTSVEAFLQNRLEQNLCTLTTSGSDTSKPIFNWTNNYSWTFKGNLAGKSQIKEAVKMAGGKVDGVLRFSIMWADGNGDNSDLDAHCIEPNGEQIYFSNKTSRYTKGNLDVDIQTPYGKLAVENITYPELKFMKDGTYKFFIRQFSEIGSKGFKAEIEFDGQIYSYTYDKRLTDKQDINVAEVTLKNGEFSIKHILPATDGEGVYREIYGLETNKFHKVNLMCLSPNHWNDNKVGNKHYMFMLDKCKVDSDIRGFHVENLIGDLLPHRKVIEVLANTCMIPKDDNVKQLSGLGFNSTVSDELVVRLQGSHRRTMKLKF